MTPSFEILGLNPFLLKTLEELNYTEPTPIQEQAIPSILDGEDVMGQAQTGTGKTAAFTLPLLQQLNDEGLQLLIMTPTRELAIQVSEAVHRYGIGMGIRVLPVYGGQSYDRQIRRLKKGVHVVVGTPGRTLDLIYKKHLDLSNVAFVVLDEADEMLKMGFVEDIEAILGATRQDRQTLLFSATFSREIRRLAQTYMQEPLEIVIESNDMTSDHVEQKYFVVYERDKVAALSRILEVEDAQNTLIFTRTKLGAAELADTLAERRFPAVAIHGDLSQQERERILARFRSGDLRILVATDVMARGVDIPDVSHVVNYDLPQLAIEYVHRIGRTGRAGRAGVALTFVTPKQKRFLHIIEKHIGRKVDRGTLPDREMIAERRREAFRSNLVNQIEAEPYKQNDLMYELMALGYSAEQILPHVLELLQAHDHRPLEDIKEPSGANGRSDRRRDRRERNRNRSNADNSRGNRRERGEGARRKPRRGRDYREEGMVRLRMQVGRTNGLRPGDVVYNIASKADIPGEVIGAIDIGTNETYFDVPHDYVQSVLDKTKRMSIRGQRLNLEKA